LAARTGRPDRARQTQQISTTRLPAEKTNWAAIVAVVIALLVALVAGASLLTDDHLRWEAWLNNRAQFVMRVAA
jgi:hypothetical protein